MNRLLRHDATIVRNTARSTFATWHDRALAILFVVIALASVRVGLDRPWPIAASIASAAAVLVGIAGARAIARRLAFHAFDGLLAAEALNIAARRRYAVAWHGVALGGLTIVLAIARPALIVTSLPSYVAGVLVAGLSGGVATSRVAGRRAAWVMHDVARRPAAGIGAAASLVALILAMRSLDTAAALGMTGIASASLGLVLARVDDAVVRFMTVVGHDGWCIVRRHVGGLATFFAAAVPAVWLAVGPTAAGIVAAACAAVLLFLTFRVLAYRLHGRRFADILAAVMAALVLLVAYALPPALPLVVGALLWRLQRRGRDRRWLLA